jgi:hypothetical protein
MARMLASDLGSARGQQIVIDNRSGRLTCRGSRASGARCSENSESKPISVLVAQM